METIFAVLTCSENEVYIKLTKKSMGYAYEEQVQIHGDNTYEVSDLFEDDSLFSWEYCLEPSTNSQYEVWFYDEYGDSWAAGSWLQIEGKYGNIVFKNYMTEDQYEIFSLSLYNPVPTVSSWKFYQGSVPQDWTSTLFDDSQWSSLSPNATIPSPSMTQYYRYAFSGLQGMAAYEVQFYYRHGIIAYMNGLEIYRDNMPTGTVTNATAALGSHTNYGFRGVIRGANEIDVSSVLTVEIHMADLASEPTREFDAWLSIYAETATDKCFIVPSETTLDSAQQQSHDWDRELYYFATEIPDTIDFHYGGNVIPVVNGFRIFASNGPTYSPRSFTLSGSASSDNYNTFLTVEDATYTTYGYNLWTVRVPTGLWRYYRLTVQSVSQSSLHLAEMQPLVCNVPVYTAITFSPTSYEFYARYDVVEIKPNQNDISGCSVHPDLPDGLTIDNSTCIISGIATSATDNITYTVTSTLYNGISGSFYLKIIECQGLMIELERIYRYAANQEAYMISDDETGDVILNVPPNHGEPDYKTVYRYVCVSSNRIRIQTEASNYWSIGSYLNVYTVLENSKKETIARIHQDSILGIPNPFVISMQYPIKANEEWYYKMGEVPSSWYSESTDGWDHAATFPPSTNRLQIYKKSFSIASLTNITAFTVNVQYRYGIIIMLNGHEVFRYAIEGELNNESYATSSYTESLFRLISLPVKTFEQDNIPSVDYLKEGTNTIAIALVSISPSQTESTFGCALRLIYQEEYSRVWDYDLSRSSQVFGDPFILARSSWLYAMNNLDNTVTVTFKDSRREWINMLTIMNNYAQNEKGVVSFQMEAKNPEDNEWTLLTEASSLQWSLAGQTKRIYIQPSKPYNMYRFVNFKGETASGWEVQSINLRIVNTNVEIQPLSYPSPVEVYRGIEMAEVYCNVENYIHFEVNPSLPTGITIDPLTGMISGTATSESAPQKYTITGTKMTGGTSTFEMTFSVALCTNGKALITMTVRTDSNPQLNHYELFTGREATGQPLYSSTSLGQTSSLVYFDFCLPDNVYTMQIVNSNGQGMLSPSGFMMSVDVGTFRMDMQQVPAGTAPVRSTIRFSSYLPFQNEFSEWYVSKQSVESSWIQTTFDESGWEQLKTGAIGTAPDSTVYLRRHFSIPSLEDYQVMNVMVKFGGGLIAYFNGKKVARFNLPESVDSTTEAATAHDATKPVFFHIILPMVGATLEDNVIAVELHRVVDTSSSIPVEFYATATFGVDECSVVRDSFSTLTGPKTLDGSLEELFDVSPMTFGSFDNTNTIAFDWTSENLEGMKFNAMAIHLTHDVTNWSSSVYGQFVGENMTTIQEIQQLNVTEQVRQVVSVPVGIAGFLNYKWETNALRIALIEVTEVLFMYCRAMGTICEEVDGFPTVADGQISPSTCGYGLDGYAYRVCEGGQFSEIKTDKCTYKAPANITYTASQFQFIRDIACSSGLPSFDNLITEWYLPQGQQLPEGLELNAETGEIHGTPRVTSDPVRVRIFGRNPRSTASVEVVISVRVAQCNTEGMWGTVPVDTIAEYDCALDGNYVGKQKRACVLGKEDGEWRDATGLCVSVLTVVLLIAAAIIVILVIIFIVIRVTHKKKPVRGTKGRKVAKVDNAKANKGAEMKAQTVKV